MPFCTNCGRPHVDGQRFCEQCGVLLVGAARGPMPSAALAAGQPVWVPRTADARGRPYSRGRLEGHWEYAHFGQRFGATLIDLVVTLTIVQVLEQGETRVFDQTLISPIFGLLYGWAGNSFGKTVGKAVVGIEVVNHAWGRPGLGRGLLREFVSFISAFAFGLGYLNVLWDEEKRAWHDHAADTWVIKRDRSYRPANAAPTTAAVPVATPAVPAAPLPLPSVDDPPTV